MNLLSPTRKNFGTPPRISLPNSRSINTSSFTFKSGVFLECFILLLLALMAPMSARAQEDSPTLRVTIDDAVVSEGDNGNATASFHIRSEGLLTEPVTLSFTTANGTATAGADYANQDGSIVFEPGVSAGVISIEVFGDTDVEENEYFMVHLSVAPADAQRVRLVRSTGIGTILNDDDSPNRTTGYAWEHISSSSDAPHRYKLRAINAAGETVSSHDGDPRIFVTSATKRPSRLVVSQIRIDIQNHFHIDLQNVTSQPLDVGGWRVVLYDGSRWPAPVWIEELLPNVIAQTQSSLVVGELPQGPPAFGLIPLRFLLDWERQPITPIDPIPRPKPMGVVLLNPAGDVEDVFLAEGADRESIRVPVQLSNDDWSGPPLGLLRGTGSIRYRRVGNRNHRSDQDWAPTVVSATPASRNQSITIPFVDAPIPVDVPDRVGPLENGEWEGDVDLTDIHKNRRLWALDGSGINGLSDPVPVPDAPDLVVESFEVSNGSINAGQRNHWRFSVRNASDVPTENVEVQLDLDTRLSIPPIVPGNSSFHSVQVSQGTWSYISGPTSKVIRFAVGTLPPGGSFNVDAGISISSIAAWGPFAQSPDPRLYLSRVRVTQRPDERDIDNNEITLLSSIGTACVDLEDGLVAWWELPASEGDVFNGVEWLPGASEEARPGRVTAGFHKPSTPVYPGWGVDPNHANAWDATNGITVALWFKIPATYDNLFLREIALVHKGEASGWSDGRLTGFNGHLIGLLDGQLFYSVGSDLEAIPATFLSSLEATPDLRDGDWHFLTWILAPDGRAQVLLDGQFRFQDLDASAGGAWDQEQMLPLMFGGWPEAAAADSGLWNPNAFSADLDEMMVYTRQLPLTDVEAIFRAGINGVCAYVLELDSDKDGIPDDVEIQLGLDRLDPTDALLDKDLDGVSNLDEYLLGTNPDDPDPPHKMTWEIEPPSSFVVRFPVVADRQYILTRGNHLTSGQPAFLLYNERHDAPGTAEVRQPLPFLDLTSPQFFRLEVQKVRRPRER